MLCRVGFVREHTLNVMRLNSSAVVRIIQYQVPVPVCQFIFYFLYFEIVSLLKVTVKLLM
jgi:hypothetical protein